MKRPHFPLPFKLALFSLLLFAGPLLCLHFASIMQEHLLEEREQRLGQTAQAVSLILENRPDLLTPTSFPVSPRPSTIDTYFLSQPISLDGEIGDWGELLEFAIPFGQHGMAQASGSFDSRSLSVTFLNGRFANDLYLLFMVKDDAVVYRQSISGNCKAGDHLRIGLMNEGGLIDFYAISPERPGPATASLMLGGPGELRPTFQETRIEGFWNDNAEGYILELRMPLGLLTNRLSLAVADIDDPEAAGRWTLLGTGGLGSNEELSYLPAKNTKLEHLLTPLLPVNGRIWVVDRHKRLRALAGEITLGAIGESTSPNRVVDRLFGMISSLFSNGNAEPSGLVGSFDLDALQRVLTGSPLTVSRSAGREGLQIVSEARPLSIDGNIEGAVVVEQGTGNLVEFKDNIIKKMLIASAAVWLFGFAFLLFFGLRLAGRIRDLSIRTDLAVGRDGRIRSSLAPSASRDELGELSRQLAAILDRLREYHHYQEKMADNLEHELRTPLAGVSASLANLDRRLQAQGDSAGEYLDDARQNMRRLEDILTRIREAAAIKDALRGDEKEKFDFTTALSAWVESSYRKTFPVIDFSLATPSMPVFILADPNRIFQMMDKLVENAADFSPAKATVEIRLAVEAEHAVIRVGNEGPELDEKLADQLFHSMVSLRASRHSEKIHMGLGLFIVRSIAEFHGGRVQAANRTDGIRGAVFSVWLPLHNWAKNITINP